MSEDTVISLLESYFYCMRFGDNHLGLGDIRLTIGQQEEIIRMVVNAMNVNHTNV